VYEIEMLRSFLLKAAPNCRVCLPSTNPPREDGPYPLGSEDHAKLGENAH